MKNHDPEVTPAEIEAMLITAITVLVGIGSVVAIAHFKGPAAATGFIMGCFFMIVAAVTGFWFLTRKR